LGSLHAETGYCTKSTAEIAESKQLAMKIVNIMTSKSKNLYGAQKASINYARVLVEMGHEVYFIVHKREHIARHLAAHPHLQLIEIRKRPLGFIKEWLAVRNIRPDAIIVHNHFSFHRYACKGLAPLILVGHNLGNQTSRHCFRYDKTMCFTEAIRDRAIHDGVDAKQLCTVPNMIYPMEIKARNHDPVVIGSLGRLVPSKNTTTFVEALGLLRQRGIDFKAIIAGNGPEEERLADMILEKKLAECVSMTGYTNNAAKDFYEKIDVFCSLSLWESFGLTVLEAFSARKASLLSDIPSFNILSDQGRNAIIVDQTRAENVAKQLELLITDRSLRDKFSSNAYSFYLDNFSPQMIGEKIEETILCLRTAEKTKSSTATGVKI